VSKPTHDVPPTQAILVSLPHRGRAGATTLVVNYLSEVTGGGSFGGAWAVASDGAVMGSFPLGQQGMLLADT
jgi:hypothetical protein